MLPPRWLRRLVVTPLMFLALLGLVATMPVWLLIGAIVSPFGSGRLRGLRVIWVVTVYLTAEVVALTVLFGLWVGSGFGWKIRSPRFQRIHYVLTGRFLTILFRQVCWALRVNVAIVGPNPDVAAPGKPDLVFCRHAGPGDSFLLIHALVNWYDREPRIVLKDTLQWDPMIDVMLNRLPSRFITASPVGAEAQIAALATGLDHNDALVLFPEGGNFTPHRRVRAIERLHRLGMHAMAERAERMRHVLAPRPGGTLAALDAAPDAGVSWVAHTGLERLITVGDIWRELPTNKTIVMRWWSVPAEEVPAGRDERINWLFDWWAKIDEWIGRHRLDESGDGADRAAS
jgi:1-acyl-sn-glycerol-3-phosphate acyltransferase